MREVNISQEQQHELLQYVASKLGQIDRNDVVNRVKDVWDNAQCLDIFIQGVVAMVHCDGAEQIISAIVKRNDSNKESSRKRQRTEDETSDNCVEAKRLRVDPILMQQVQKNIAESEELNQSIAEAQNPVNCDDLVRRRDVLWQETSTLISNFVNPFNSVLAQVESNICNKQSAQQLLYEYRSMQIRAKKLQYELERLNFEQHLINKQLNDLELKDSSDIIEKKKNNHQQIQEVLSNIVSTKDDIANIGTTLQRYSYFGEVKRVIIKHSLAQYKHLTGNIYERAGQQCLLFEVDCSMRERLEVVHSIQNEQIITISLFFEENEKIYVETPFHEYVTLSEWIKDKSSNELRWMLNLIVRAIASVHEHNITCSSLSSNMRIRVNKTVLPVISLFHTETSTAPEVIRGETPTMETDCWDLGVLICQMFTKQTPIITDDHCLSISSICSNMNFDVKGDIHIFDLLSKLLRYQSISRSSIKQIMYHEFLLKAVEDPNGSHKSSTLCTVKGFFELFLFKVSDMKLILNVDSDDILGKTGLVKIGRMDKSQILRPFDVKFVGEMGVDSGALSTSLSSRIFSELIGSGLLEHEENSSVYSFSKDDSNNTGLFTALGQLVCRMIILGQPLPVSLAPYIWCSILKENTNSDLHSLELVDPIAASSFRKLLYCENVEEMGMEYEDGTVVTDDNRCHFTRQEIQRRLLTSRDKNLSAFLNGLEVIPQLPTVLGMLDLESLLLLVNPATSIDINTLISCLFCPDNSSTPYHYLVEIIAEFSQQEAKQFLFFVTGQSSLLTPQQSRTPLMNPNIDAERRNKIAIYFDSTKKKNTLPVAHVCFYQLIIPIYQSKEQMKSKLFQAFQESSEYFGLI
jgi:hypothetical protein